MLLSLYIPQSIAQTKVFTALFNTEQPEIDTLNADITDLINQCFVDTATWGLDYWENFLGIATDHSKDIDYRRTVIKSKIRGSGTVTVSLVENVANSFNNGQVKVIEHPEISTIEIQFVSSYGIPPNLSDLQNALNSIMPAHLAIIYTYLYAVWSASEKTTWGAIKSGGTWGNLKNGQIVQNS